MDKRRIPDRKETQLRCSAFANTTNAI